MGKLSRTSIHLFFSLLKPFPVPPWPVYWRPCLKPSLLLCTVTSESPIPAYSFSAEVGSSSICPLNAGSIQCIVLDPLLPLLGLLKLISSILFYFNCHIGHCPNIPFSWNFYSIHQTLYWASRKDHNISNKVHVKTNS